MALRILFWKNIKRRKTFSITVLIFMCLVSLILIASTTTFYNVNSHMNETLKRNNAPDYMSWIPGESKQVDQTWLHEIEAHDSVAQVELESLIGVSSSIVFIKGTALDNSLYLKSYQPEAHTYQLLYGEQDTLPNQGSVYLPYVYKEFYACDRGDTITMKFPGYEQTFTIADFFEDSVYGNSMFSLKYMLLAQEDLDRLASQTDMKTFLNYTQVNTYLNPTSDPEKAIFQLNQDVSLEKGSSFAYSLSFFESATRWIPSLILLVIMAFSILMFLITLLVLSYALKAAISEDTLEIGIMKAVGFTEQQIQRMIVFQYGVVALLGILMGAIASLFIFPSLETMVLSSSGLFPSGSPQPWIIFWVSLLLMVFIYGIIKYNTQQIRKISCVCALQARNEDVYFSSFLTLSIDRFLFLPLQFRLSCKHIFTHLKQYTMVLVITLLLSECLLTVLTINRYFQKEGMASITGGMDTDIYIDYHHEEDLLEIPKLIEEIEKSDPILLSYMSGGEHFRMDDMQVYTVYTDTFDESFTAPPLQGRFPKYDNEIMITEMVLKAIQKKVGDTVMIATNDGKEAEYLIVGAHQTFNEMGKQSMMIRTGIERLGVPAFGYRYNIQFKERGQKAELVDRLNQKLSEEHLPLHVVDEYENIKQYSEAEQIAILAVTFLILVLSTLLIGLISFLLVKISLEKEKTELAILKFQGFTIHQLQHQFAMRFTIIACLGSLLGVLLNVCTNSKILSALLSNVGVTHFSSYYSIGYLLAPIILMMSLTYLSCILTTRKIKKINVQALTNDN